MSVLNYQDLGVSSVGGALFIAHQVAKEMMATLNGLGNVGLGTIASPASSVELPAMYRADLHQLADYLTFSKEFGFFLRDQQLDRTEIIEALQWSLGAVFTKSMFFPKPKEV